MATVKPLPARVRAFDPTATTDEEKGLDLRGNVSFHKLGVAHFNGNTQVFVDHRQEGVQKWNEKVLNYTLENKYRIIIQTC